MKLFVVEKLEEEMMLGNTRTCGIGATARGTARHPTHCGEKEDIGATQMGIEERQYEGEGADMNRSIKGKKKKQWKS